MNTTRNIGEKRKNWKSLARYQVQAAHISVSGQRLLMLRKFLHQYWGQWEGFSTGQKGPGQSPPINIRDIRSQTRIETLTGIRAELMKIPKYKKCPKYGLGGDVLMIDNRSGPLLSRSFMCKCIKHNAYCICRYPCQL